MKVLTVKTIETLDKENQLDIHYILKMEHYADYVFQDKNSAQYTATISMDDTAPVIEAIIKLTIQLPEYNFVIDNLDMQDDMVERLRVRNGEILEKKTGNMGWS